MKHRNQILHGDCLELMGDIPDGSVDMILCDLPYGITACSWDSVIPLEPLWKHYKRVIKKNGAIVLTASQPFTSRLVMSNLQWFKYCWVWEKNRVTGVLNAKYQPLRQAEDIAVFCKTATVYNPQGISECEKTTNSVKSENYHPTNQEKYLQTQTGYPTQIIKFDSVMDTLHPTQKPLELFHYLINTYTIPGELVLDNCAGSGTTGIACLNTGRDYILMEKEEKYFEIIKDRIGKHLAQGSLL